MGFSNLLKPTSGRGKTDIDKLSSYAAKLGIELPEPEEKKSGILGGLQKFGEIVNTGAFLSGSVMAKLAGKEFKKEETAFEGRILPSEVIFGVEKRDAKSIGESLKQSFFTTEGLMRMGVDILFDPITYITLGTGSALKVTTKAGAKVAVSKTAKTMIKELAEEVGEKAAKQTVATLASVEKTATLLSRGGLQNIKKGLAAAGKEFTRKNVDDVLANGIKELRAAGGIKFMGKTVIPAEIAKAPFKWALEAGKSTKVGAALYEGLEKTGKSIVKLVSRDYGLDEMAIQNKQVFLDGVAAAQERIAKEIDVIFLAAPTTQREAITLAIEEGSQGIAKLSPEFRPLAKRVKSILKTIGKEDEKYGLLNSWIPDYVPHAYKNIEKRKALLSAFKNPLKEGQPSALLKFAKERRIPTFKEAEALGLEPIKDIAIILNMRKVASEKARLAQRFFKKTAFTSGKRGRIPVVSKMEIGEAFTKGKLVKSLDEVITNHPAQPLKDFIDIKGNVSKELFVKKAPTKATIGQFGFSNFDEAQKSFNNLTELKNLLDDTARISIQGTEAEKLDIFNKVTARLGGEQPGLGIELGQVSKTFNRNVLELNENLVRLGDAGIGVPERFENIFIPNHIADDIGKMERRFFNDDELNLLLRGYDKALNFFKGSVTVMFPAFHGRNAISNVQQNFLDISVQSINPARHKEAVAIMTGGKGSLINEFGTKISYEEIRKLARAKQVLTNRVTRIDIDKTLTKSVLKKNTPFEVGRKLGSAIEGEARMVNFITNLRRGFSPDDAAKKVKEFVMDYDNLTLFEKNFMKRAIPFYTWTRKNIAIQMKALVEQPGKQINTLKVLSQIDEMFGVPKTKQEKEFAPDYIQAGMNMLLGRKGDDSTFLLGFDLPIEDAFEFFDTPGKKVLTSLSPFLKAPIEAVTGYNFFREEKIKEDDSGRFAKELPNQIKKFLDYSSREVETKEGKTFTIEKVDPTRKWIFQNIASLTGGGRFVSTGFVEPMTSFWKMMKGDEKLTIEDKVNFVRFLLGLRAFTVDIDAAQKASEKNDLEELENILIRKGVLGRFEKTFTPAETKKGFRF